MTVRWGLAAAAAVLLVASCTSAAVPTSAATAMAGALPLNLENGTTVAVRLVVNGQTVETVPPGTTQAPVSASLPAMPWTIQALSPSGRELARLDVAGPSALAGSASRWAAADLACGRLVVSVGQRFVVEPTFVPDPSKPCD